jgi:eukaryotic-like serine/threonine-protein kinase
MTPEPAQFEATGTRLGPYRIIKPLGAGGMGQVYLGLRDDAAYEQQVAIKIMLGGPWSRDLQARFKTERQILARLQHPNIARLQDGGTTADGTPYLVMEYVDGEPIDQYCDARNLSLTDRLRLFRTVCAAVHAAHQHLIVHRDLKPSNILVTQDGAPKLLDFGIAKLLDASDSGLHTLAVTHEAHRMLTPDHASPEQVRGEDITTASDVYVLGVLLYELLTGHRPFQLTSRRIVEIEKAICEKDAEPPSSYFADQSNEEARKKALQRSSTPARLRRALAGDLDNIVLMAMRKEPERRYGSAQQFASDIGRFLDGRPVIARRDTLGYRTTKFLRRNWPAAIATSCVLVLLCAFAAVSYMQAKRLAAERDLVALQKEKVERERSRAAEMSEFLVNLLRMSDPERNHGKPLSIRELLDSTADRLRSSLATEPEAKIALLNTVGSVYNNLGLYAEALRALDESLELQASLPTTAPNFKVDALLQQGRALTESGKLREAEAPLAEAMKVAQARFGGVSVETARSIAMLGKLRQTQGRFASAEQLYRRALRIFGNAGDSLSELTWLLNDLAQVLERRDQWQQAKVLYSRAMEIDSRLLGQDHPHLAYHMLNLAQADMYLGDLDAAAPLYNESLRRLEATYGPNHPDTIKAWGSYGRYLQRIGRLDAAGEYLRRALQASEALYGPNHMQVGYQRVNLGMLLQEKRQLTAAELEFHQALAIYSASLPANHPWRGALLTQYARLLADMRRPKEALALADEAVAIWSNQAFGGSTQLDFARAARAYALLVGGQARAAQAELVKLYPELAQSRGGRDPMVQKAHDWLLAADRAVTAHP